MRFVALLLVSIGLACAEEEAVPEVSAVISERLKDLPEPGPTPIPKGITMAVTAGDPAAQRHVLEGLANLHGSWDFEAYRHFCAALKLDPDCLMAHWGVVLALIDPEPEFKDERDAALRRMVALVEREAGTELERSYAFGLVVFLDKGAAQAANLFRQMVEKYPNDPQLKLMAAAFGRSGYDDEGKPNPDQEKAESMIDEMLMRDPDHPLLLYAFLSIRAEAPDLRGDVDRARQLCQVAPGYGPFLHLLGHYELRTGNFTRAIEAFGQAAEFYRRWMKANGLGHADCPGWVKAECYRAAALASKGDYGNALAVAESIAAIKLPPARATSEGGQLLLWEGRTLAARLLMRRSLPGDAARAIKTLPDPEFHKTYGGRTLSVYYYQGLAILLEARKLLDEGKPADALKVAELMARHGEQMAKTSGAAKAGGERSSWTRAFIALEVAASELRGLMAMAGPKEGRGSAFNWFRAALDRQSPPSMLMPPSVLLPMQARLADFHMAKGEVQGAIDILIEGQTRHTHDVEILYRLQRALLKAGHQEQAAEVGRELERVRSE